MSLSKTCSGGRKKDAIWQFFEEVSGECGKTLGQKCLQCGKLVSGRVLRMKSHHVKCKTMRNIESNISGARKRSSPSPSTSSESEITESPCSKKKPVYQPKIYDSFVKISAEMSDILDLDIAKFFFACNIPFSCSENYFFQKMIGNLRPGYTPPNRKKLAGELLNKVNSEVENTIKEELDGKNVTLMQDGWSNIHNEPVIVNSLSTGTKSFFLSSISPSSNKKTSQYCLSLAKQAIKEAKMKYNCSVKSFVSDNENKMRKMREDLCADQLIDGDFFLSYGCACHFLNLLGNDISVSVNPIMSQVIEVQKHFRNHHAAKGYLSEYDRSVIPQLSCETRWNSQITCIDTFLRNREFLMKIADEHEDEIPDNIINIINNVHLYKEAKNFFHQLKPLAAALNSLQAEDATIADVVNEFFKLQENQDLKPYEKLLNKRLEQCLTPFHFAAYMLHPRYQGEKLNSSQEESARKVLSDVNADFLTIAIQFQAKSDPFPKSYFSDAAMNVTPVSWWLSLKRHIDNKFCEFVIHMLSCIASSASIERLFSTFGFIHNKSRNRLDIENSSKLVNCYKNLNLKTYTAKKH